MQLEDVVENGTVFLDYDSVVDIAVLATSRHPAGEDSAFYLAKSPMGAKAMGEDVEQMFAFYSHKMSPWFERFDSKLGWLENAGVWLEEFKRAKYVNRFGAYLKKKYQENALCRTKLSKKYKKIHGIYLSKSDDDDVRMTFDSYKAIFGFYFASLGVPLVVLFLEYLGRKNRSKIRDFN